MAEQFNIDKAKTALVIIDLQKGIAGRDTKPYAANEVIANSSKLLAAFRKNGMKTFLVHVAAAPDTMLKALSDESWSRPANTPADWADFVPEIAPTGSDVVIDKKQWGAFYGTDLELRMRRSGVDTIVLCGIATDYGVESTARFAYEYGFQQIFAEDAMASMSEEQHNAAVKYVFKRMGRVRKTQEILDALQ